MKAVILTYERIAYRISSLPFEAESILTVCTSWRSSTTWC